MIREQVIGSTQELRTELGKLPSRTGHSLTLLAQEAKLSLSVVNFVKQPEKRKDTTVAPVLALFQIANHEVIIRRKGDKDGVPVTSIDDVRGQLELAAEQTGRSKSDITKAAGLSLAIVDFVNHPQRRKSIQFSTMVGYLGEAGYELVVRRNGGWRRLSPAQIRGGA